MDITSLTVLNATPCIELGIKDAGTGAVRSLDIDGQTVRVSIVERLNAPSYWRHLIVTKTPGLVDRALKALSLSATPFIQVRFGLRTSNKSTMLPWQEHQVVLSHPEHANQGYQVLLISADRLDTISRQSEKTRARQGKISDIVSAIASENGLESVVEPTKSTDNELYIQSFEDDVTFIKTRLLPKAVNEKGRGNYRLFVQDNVLHFHSPDFKTDVKALNYFGNSGAISLRYVDVSQVNSHSGAAGVDVVVADPYTGGATQVSSKVTNVLNYAQVTPDFTQTPGAVIHIRRHEGSNRLDELKNLGQSTFEAAYSRMFKIELTVTKMPYLRLNDTLNVIIAPSPTSISPWSGYYNVTEAYHDYENTSLVSRFILERGELLSSNLSSKRVNDVVSGENFASGEAINVGVARVTKITQGQETSLITGEILKDVKPS